MSQITFHWEAKDQTPELLAAIGLVIVTWTRIDNEITRILEPFWSVQKPEERMPRPFDQRITILREIVTPFYNAEPDELRAFLWYLERLKSANGNRDNISHGIAGKITKGRKTFPGLMVAFPSKATKHISYSLEQIQKLGARLEELEGETVHVSAALRAVYETSLPDRRVWRASGGWSRPTMETRTDRLPRYHAPPPAFQPSLQTSATPPSGPPSRSPKLLQRIVAIADWPEPELP